MTTLRDLTISTLGPVSTDGITVHEHYLPARRACAQSETDNIPARPYGTGVDGMAIYKGLQL
jgi:hypothetical protein